MSDLGDSDGASDVRSLAGKDIRFRPLFSLRRFYFVRRHASTEGSFGKLPNVSDGVAQPSDDATTVTRSFDVEHLKRDVRLLRTIIVHRDIQINAGLVHQTLRSTTASLGLVQPPDRLPLRSQTSTLPLKPCRVPSMRQSVWS
ncbi:hypothetical protein NLI96_g6728 [Meripilus lineatus]|uniref:Uncharacterized protein n=1 Tax=Meripilus lineatus TaxID=2056292 RepID=A0AAD5V0I8_9APHY|nr:hypothetical protein NLI96_g6728 [Physisporinus lineatus]